MCSVHALSFLLQTTFYERASAILRHSSIRVLFLLPILLAAMISVLNMLYQKQQSHDSGFFFCSFSFETLPPF